MHNAYHVPEKVSQCFVMLSINHKVHITNERDDTETNYTTKHAMTIIHRVPEINKLKCFVISSINLS